MFRLTAGAEVWVTPDTIKTGKKHGKLWMQVRVTDRKSGQYFWFLVDNADEAIHFRGRCAVVEVIGGVVNKKLKDGWKATQTISVRLKGKAEPVRRTGYDAFLDRIKTADDGDDLDLE